jgi:hypothetical protein
MNARVRADHTENKREIETYLEFNATRRADLYTEIVLLKGPSG